MDGTDAGAGVVAAGAVRPGIGVFTPGMDGTPAGALAGAAGAAGVNPGRPGMSAGDGSGALGAPNGGVPARAVAKLCRI
jgi:hypothetical protein